MEDTPLDPDLAPADRRQQYLKQLAILGIEQAECIRDCTQRLIEAGGSPAEVLHLAHAFAATAQSVRQTIALSIKLDATKPDATKPGAAKPGATKRGGTSARTRRVWSTQIEPVRPPPPAERDDLVECVPRLPRLN